MASSTRVFELRPPRLSALPRAARSGVTLASAAVVAALIIVALFAPLLAPYAPEAQDLAGRLQPPGPRHLLGTDDLGRDILSRLIFGARVSLSVVLIVEIIEIFFGGALGLLAGYYGGWLDTVIMRLADVMFAFPDILLAILITGILGK